MIIVTNGAVGDCIKMICSSFSFSLVFFSFLDGVPGVPEKQEQPINDKEIFHHDCWC